MNVIRRDESIIQQHQQIKLGNMRKMYISRINDHVGQVRELFITNSPGQDMIYQAKEAEAVRFLSLDPEPADLTDFPFIQAETGVLAETPFEVAQIWLFMAQSWRSIAASLEGIRVKASNDIQECQSEEDMEVVLDYFKIQVEALS